VKNPPSGRIIISDGHKPTNASNNSLLSDIHCLLAITDLGIISSPPIFLSCSMRLPFLSTFTFTLFFLKKYLTELISPVAASFAWSHRSI